MAQLCMHSRTYRITPHWPLGRQTTSCSMRPRLRCCWIVVRFKLHLGLVRRLRCPFGSTHSMTPRLLAPWPSKRNSHSGRRSRSDRFFSQRVSSRTEIGHTHDLPPGAAARIIRRPPTAAPRASSHPAWRTLMGRTTGCWYSSSLDGRKQHLLRIHGLYVVRGSEL